MGILVLMIAHFLLVNWFNFAKNVLTKTHRENRVIFIQFLLNTISLYIDFLYH